MFNIKICKPGKVARKDSNHNVMIVGDSLELDGAIIFAETICDNKDCLHNEIEDFLCNRNMFCDIDIEFCDVRNVFHVTVTEN